MDLTNVSRYIVVVNRWNVIIDVAGPHSASIFSARIFSCVA